LLIFSALILGKYGCNLLITVSIFAKAELVIIKKKNKSDLYIEKIHY